MMDSVEVVEVSSVLISTKRLDHLEKRSKELNVANDELAVLRRVAIHGMRIQKGFIGGHYGLDDALEEYRVFNKRRGVVL